MYRAFLFALLIGFKALSSVENPITVGTAVQINDSNYSSFTAWTPIVSVNSTGYMITYRTFHRSSGGAQMWYAFSSTGNSWSSDFIEESAQTTVIIWNTGSTAGFLATFAYPPPGGGGASAQSSFSSNQGATWSSFSVIDAGPGVSSTLPIPGLAVTGGYMASWKEGLNNFSSFSGNNGTTWSTASQINTSNTSSPAVLSTNSSGVLATWPNSSPTVSFSSNLGTSWSSEVQISDNSASGLVFSSSNDDGFIAVWYDSTDDAIVSSFSTDNGSTWNAPTTISTDVTATSSSAAVTACDSGFIATWIDSSSNANASFSSDNGTTWSDPVQITNDGSVDFSTRDFVSVSCSGNTCVFTWREKTTLNIMASSGTIGIGPEAPSNASGQQKKNDFGMQFELFNRLTWSASSSTISGYKVYREGVNIATLPADTLFFEDHNQPKGVQKSYTITAFNSSGTESSAASVTVNPL